MDAKKFYREIGKNKVMIKEAAPKDSIEKFWKGIWGEKSYVCKLNRECGERK